MSERIVSAAIRVGDLVLSVMRPGRHHDILALLSTGKPAGMQMQGFLTSDGRFVGRREAREIADAAGQIMESEFVDGIPRKRSHPELFSEDLW